jgi:glycosyltransferase involved in cell wall biosynthesis
VKIALVTPDVTRGQGQGRVNYEVVREAIARGVEVTLLSQQVAPELAQASGARWVEFPVRGLATQLARDLWFGFRVDRWLRRHAMEYDLVMVNGDCSWPWAASDVNAVHFVHGTWLQSPYHVSRVTRGPWAWYQWVYTRLHASLERRVFDQARVIVAVSTFVEDRLRALGVPPERVRVIPNGVDTVEFCPGRVERGRMGLPDGVPMALFVGDIRLRRKNLELVLEALTEVDGLHVAVAGATERSPYPAMARELGVEGRVHFLGFRRDIPALMQAVDMFVFPSRYESNALVLLEALAAGLPVISTRTGAAETLVTPDCGILLRDPSDRAGMREALRRLVIPSEREPMRTAARERALSHTWTNMARGYLALFEELSASRPGQS